MFVAYWRAESSRRRPPDGLKRLGSLQCAFSAGTLAAPVSMLRITVIPPPQPMPPHDPPWLLWSAGKGYSSDSPTFTAGPKSLMLAASASGAANGRAPQSAPLSAVITSSVRRWFAETKEAAQRGDVVRRCAASVWSSFAPLWVMLSSSSSASSRTDLTCTSATRCAAVTDIISSLHQCGTPWVIRELESAGPHDRSRNLSSVMSRCICRARAVTCACSVGK